MMSIPREQIPALSFTGGEELNLLTALLSEDPRGRLLLYVNNAAHVGTNTIDGTACDHLVLRKGMLDVHVWVTAGDTPHVRRLAPDLNKLLADQAAARGVDVSEMPETTLNVDITDWSTDAPADDAFAFAAPADAEKADSLLKEPDNPQSLIGKAAPTFKLDKLGGGTVDLAAHHGKDIVILDFWATWCGPCRKGLPIIEQVAKDYAARGVAFYAVNLRETDAQAAGYVKKAGHAFDVAMDREAEVGKMYYVGSIPQTVIIDKNGIVQVVHIGFNPNLRAQLSGELDALLRGESLADADH